MKILIVEDDTMLRNWLSMLLSSLSDYQLQIYEASDGLEALEVCQKMPVELVITDIKMPRMDGLHLIQKLKESDPEILTAVLSSYDDFSFVKVALQYGALDYILKAEMTVKDLSQLLDKVQNDFQVEHSLAKGIFPDFRTISGAQKAVTDFLAGQLSQNALLEMLNLPADAPTTALLFLHLQDKSDGDVPIFEAADICTKTLFSENLHGMAIPYRAENCLLFYGCSDSVTEFQQMEAIKLISLIENNFQKYLDLPIRFHFYQFCRQEEDLRKCLDEVGKAGHRYQYYGANVECADSMPGFTLWKGKIQRFLEANHPQEAASDLKNFLSEAHWLHLSPDILRAHLLVLMNLFTSFHGQSQEQGIGSQPEGLHPLLVDVTHAETKEGLERGINTFLKTFLLTLNQRKLDLSPAIRSALAYVDEHYAEKISLDGVVEHIFINRSYFCQLFKKEVGLTFGNYVEHIRIENAKRLLASTNLPILNVAEQTGFNNQAYFTKVFKKATDISPLQYRRIHFQKSDKKEL